MKTDSIHFVPELGFTDSMFDELLPDRCVQLVVIWRERLDEGRNDAARKVILEWIRDRELWSGCEHPDTEVGFINQTSLGSWGLAMTLVHVAYPRIPLSTLFERLESVDVHAKEIITGVNINRGKYVVPSPDPRAAAPAGSFESMDDYWRTAFDLQGLAPTSESLRELDDVLEDDDLKELRLTQLHVEGLRICYVTPTPNFLAATARSTEVEQVVRDEVQRVFSGLMDSPDEPCKVPHFFGRDGSMNDSVERIFRNGRLGYSIAFYVSDLRARYATNFRYREYELLTCLRAAIERLGLEPVVLWRRFGAGDGAGHCEFQIWEKPTSECTQQAVHEIAAARQAAMQSQQIVVVPTLEAFDIHTPQPRPGVEFGLPEGVQILESTNGIRVALLPDQGHAGMHKIALVTGDSLDVLDVPPSAGYEQPERRAFSIDGRHLFLLTDVALRSVNLHTREVSPLMYGTGYRELACLADGLVVVRGAFSQIEVSTEEPDVADMLRKSGKLQWGPTVRFGASPCLWLIDMQSQSSALVQTIPGSLRQIRAVHGGRVLVAHSADADLTWRTAVLAPKGRRLRLVARLRDALPDATDVGDTVVSSNACEALNLLAAAERAIDDYETPDLESPDLT